MACEISLISNYKNYGRCS